MTLKKKAFYFDPYADGLAVFLGPTETKLMEVAWAKREVSVKSARFHLADGDAMAYTTVETVLGRLAAKGFLNQTRQGRAYVYTPAVDKADFLRERVTIVKECLKRNFSSLD